MSEQKNTATALTTAPPVAVAKTDYGIDVGRVVAMRAAVEEVVAKVLREGEHYGEIPGTTKEGKKPKKSLFQPGAEVLCQVFRLRPQFEVVTREERDDFLFREVTCRLYNSVTGELVGEASGSANTREEKYTAQTASKLCPACKQPTIFRSKPREGDNREPGWFCWAKKGGCGAQFDAEDKKLLDQSGAVSSDKVWNLHHTIVSMAQKRAYVKATRNATATSDIFTDEDAPAADDDQPGHRAAPKPAAAAAPKASATQVRDLNDALKKAGVGSGIDPNLPREEQAARFRKVKLDWINGMLEDFDAPPVANALDLSPDQCDALTQEAKAGRVPRGW